MDWKRWAWNTNTKTVFWWLATLLALYGYHGVSGLDSLVPQPQPDGAEYRPPLRPPARVWQIRSPQVPGQVAFGAADEMTQGEEQMVVVRISLDKTEDLTKGLPPNSKATVDAIAVVPNMTVKLDDGNDFGIVPLTPEKQFIARDRFTEWEFRVTAFEAGIHELHLHVGIRTKIGPVESDERFYPMYEHKIVVKVNRVYVVERFLGENWKWMIGTLCLPVIWYLVKR